jgi:hypothetical protein
VNLTVHSRLLALIGFLLVLAMAAAQDKGVVTSLHLSLVSDC